MREYDALGRNAFLAKYGFGQSRSYFLVSDGKRYDSKAIVGAAHGFVGEGFSPLTPADFSGGAKTVQTLLSRLGFDVESATPGRSGWTWEERTLALDLYLREGTANKTSSSVAQLSAELNRRAFHPDAGTRPDFRNPAGVALKLANFAALDPTYEGVGMVRFSTGDEQTWEEFADDEDALADAVAAIRSGAPTRSLEPDASRTVRKGPVEAQHSRSYEVPERASSGTGFRREAELVLEFAAYLEAQGHRVSAHSYQVGTRHLRNDLADDTAQVLWEAKGSVDRAAVRMALGQLIDYQRFEDEGWAGGVLLPRRPAIDLLNLIHSAGRSAAWQTGKSSFVVQEPS